jgi:F0F1-type ATP synthase delta subunit
MSDHPESVMTLQAEEFEKLLEQASEAKNEWPSFLQRAENEELVQAFVSDVQTRKGKMDSLMKVVYDKNNTPDVESMLFVIPGEKQSWLVSGITESEFRVETAHRDGLRSIF